MANDKRGTGGKREALLEAMRPKVRGRIIDEGDSIVLDCGGCTIDVPAKSVVRRQEMGTGYVEVTVEPDAQLIVSTLVTPDKGFVTDNVFGALVDSGMLSDNCNCNCSGGNCNCNCSGGGGSIQELQGLDRASFRLPFQGGAKRQLMR